MDTCSEQFEMIQRYNNLLVKTLGTWRAERVLDTDP